jgi:hypothetical protein
MEMRNSSAIDCSTWDSDIAGEPQKASALNNTSSPCCSAWTPLTVYSSMYFTPGTLTQCIWDGQRRSLDTLLGSGMEPRRVPAVCRDLSPHIPSCCP